MLQSFRSNAYGSNGVSRSLTNSGEYLKLFRQHFLEPIDVQKVDQLLVMADRFVMTSDPSKKVLKFKFFIRQKRNS